MVAVAKQVVAQGCGPCVLIRTYEFDPRRSPTRRRIICYVL